MEKASREQLDDFTANAGKNNYTKYARDVDDAGYFNGKKQGVEWCAVFVSWCFLQAYGKSMALKLQCQPTKNNAGAGCKSAMSYYKARGQLHDAPEVGDQIFFGTDHSAPTHTGLVYEVDAANVYTVEGNTSAGSAVIANGGMVCKKKYALSNARIAGYGRPDYAQAGEAAPQDEEGNKAMQMVVTADTGFTVNLRANSSAQAAIIAQVPVGAVVAAEIVNNDWARVAYNNRAGYMMVKFLREQTGAGEASAAQDYSALVSKLQAAKEAIEEALQEIRV